MTLQGKHAFVTGGSRGIGRIIAARSGREWCAGNGARPERRCAGSRDRRGRRAFLERRRRRRSGRTCGAVADATSRNGPVDILVANAGVAPAAPFLKTSADTFRETIAINLLGVTEAARAVLGGMIERKSGRIIAIASTAGLKGYPYVSPYVASKHAVIGFVRALALETAKTGVTVNAVCPGFTETDIVVESIERIVAKTGRTREAALAELVKHNPQQRLIQPEEVADTVLWLCSDGARSVTGQAISVSGERPRQWKVRACTWTPRPRRSNDPSIIATSCGCGCAS